MIDYRKKYIDLVNKYNTTIKKYSDALEDRDNRIHEANNNIRICNKEIMRLREKLDYYSNRYVNQPRRQHTSRGNLYTKRMHLQDDANQAMIDMNDRGRNNQPSSGWWFIDKIKGV